jgi:hypothetical protein
MATVSQVSGVIAEIEAIAKEIAAEVVVLDPAIGVPVTVALSLADLITKALSAWSAASDTPITAESVLALLPDPTPLTPPTI